MNLNFGNTVASVLSAFNKTLEKLEEIERKQDELIQKKEEVVTTAKAIIGEAQQEKEKARRVASRLRDLLK